MQEGFAKGLQSNHNFSEGSISFLLDKSFREKDFQELYNAMKLPDEIFAEWRESKSALEKLIAQGDAKEITDGRYEEYVAPFADISSEQALVKGRLKFAIEYDIALADFLSEVPEAKHLVDRKFTDEEKAKLRNIYQNFRTKDFAAVKIIETRTDHDIVAANTWATIRAQQEGLDDALMRRITHFARTSDDVNANVVGELYMNALGYWTKSLSNLVSELEQRAEKYAEVTCVGETHGQDAQLTTVGHIFANLAEQIARYAKPFLRDDMIRLEGKIGGAIGTDVDMHAAFPNFDPTEMYRGIVEEKFKLEYVDLGNDQPCVNAAFSEAFDTLSNVTSDVEKAAGDLWLYASRGIIAKKTEGGSSGSSAMPQKANPFRAESTEALAGIINGMVAPIKKSLISYREQGDLRRSITLREAFHPIMLAIIATRRITDELKNYDPDIIQIQKEIYENGPKIISSCISTKLKAVGVPDAYDSIKKVVMKPRVEPEEIKSYISKMVEEERIDTDTAAKLEGWLYSVMDTRDLINKLYASSDVADQKEIIENLKEMNKDSVLQELIGNAIPQTYRIVERSKETQRRLSRYAK